MDKPEIIHFPKLSDSRGCLVFMEGNKHFPFRIESISIIENFSFHEIGIEQRNIGTKEVLISLNGSADVFLHDSSFNVTKFHLTSRNYCVYVPSRFSWSLRNISLDFSVLVISDEKSNS